MGGTGEVSALLQESVVCDMTLPGFEPCMIDQDVTLPRFRKAGFDFA